MKRTFKYGKIDRRAKILTIVFFLSIVAILFLVWYFWGEGGYATAWTVSLIAAVVLLCLLSVPRKLEVTDTAVEIRCVVEIIRIPLSDLGDVRAVDPEEVWRRIPVMGVYGFFGYYGLYLDPGSWELERVYCTERRNLIEITDIYEKRYIVSCPRGDDLLAAIDEARRFYYKQDNLR